MASFSSLVAMLHTTLPQFSKPTGIFCPLLYLSASENCSFGGPLEGLDDHYPSITKRNGTPYPTQECTKRRGSAKWKGQVEVRELGLELYLCCACIFKNIFTFTLKKIRSILIFYLI